ncbi:hypothetical protein SK128_000475 [Halocaridina rubra]|uniref:Uncharacterized protein n=1 Tax=Halocaridina rubra TaxID=373956 RepID=A0AAN8XA43_HALRR
MSHHVNNFILIYMDCIVEVYSGNESPLLLERKYRVQYRCTFDLNLYPFDTQLVLKRDEEYVGRSLLRMEV